MKKMMKKIAVPVLSVAMLLGTIAAPAFANGVQTYGAKCPECNRGEIVMTSSYNTQEVTLKEYDCAKNPTKKDKLVYYVTYTSWACTYCGQGDTQSIPHQEPRCDSSH